MSEFSRQAIDAAASCIVREGGASQPIHDVVVRSLTTHRDPRGTLTELLRADWADVFGPAMPFKQVYTSMTAPGIARDFDKWHVHQHQTDRFYCLAGRIVVAIADWRDGSPTKGRLMLVELGAPDDGPAPLLVTIPPRTFHGFVVMSPGPATLLNFPNQLYDPADEGRTPLVEAGVTLPDGTPFDYRIVSAVYAGEGAAR